MGPALALAAGLAFVLCPPMGEPHTGDGEFDAVRYWAAGPERPRESTALGGPNLVGQWQRPYEWQVTAIHAVMLPTGQVLHYSYPNGGDGSRARLWDPVSFEFEDVSVSRRAAFVDRER